MKYYYTEISVDFLDISIDEDNPDGTKPYEGKYVDSFIVHAKNDATALKKVFEQAYSGFRENYNEENILKSFHIDVFYETSDNARSS